MRPVLGAVLIALCALAAAPISAQTYADGARAFEEGEYGEAASIFIPLAMRGDPDAAFALGRQYAEGLGVPADQEQAKRWFKRGLIAEAERSRGSRRISTRVAAAEPSSRAIADRPLETSRTARATSRAGPRGHVDLGVFDSEREARRIWTQIARSSRTLADIRPRFQPFASRTALGAYGVTRAEADAICAAAARADVDDCKLYF